MQPLHDRYGEGPLHLIAVVASFAIVAYAFVEIVKHPGALSFAIFFGGAIVLHDLIAFPIYSALNLVAGRTGSIAGAAGSAINYLRVPTLLSAFALIVWFPLILGLDDALYVANTGHERAPYLERWLLITAALFIGSGVVYALKRRRARGPDPATDPRDAHSRR